MKLSPRSSALILGLALGLLTAAPAAAERGSKLDTVLRSANRRGAVHHVIITTQPDARVFLKQALQSHGDAVSDEFPTLNALAVALHGEDLAALEADPRVLSVSFDAEVRSLGEQGRADQDGTGATRVSKARQPAPIDVLRETLGLTDVHFSGVGINVAVVDSGIDANKDLAASIAGFWDFTRGGIARRPRDDYGHGTHVAGLIASSGFDSKKEFAGVAPGVNLYGFKVLDDKGRGRVSNVVRAIEFIVANKRSRSDSSFKIDVINLSLGHPIYEPAVSDPLVRAVENAVRNGIVVVTAAGNTGAHNGDVGYTGINSPGNAPSAITVGASDTRNTINLGDDTVALFSSRGPTWFDGFAKPDFVAPGVALTSDIPRSSSLFDLYPQPEGGKGNFAKLSGTSMAAAVTTGAVALVLEASRVVNHGDQALTPNALKAVLQYTALTLKDATGQPYDALTQGTGEINVHGALKMALAINTDMPVGSQWLRWQPTPTSVIGGVAYPWSQALIWDDNIVWGTDALSFNGPQWDDNIVWGTASFDEDNIVWGTSAEFDNIVWGTVATWAGDLVWHNRIIGLMTEDDNIVWGTVEGLTDDNIVWGTSDGDNIVWGTWEDDNIVWGTSEDDNIVWGTSDDDNIVWGTSDNIVWGTLAGRER